MIERIRAFRRSVEERVCDEPRPVRLGTAFVTESLPLVWSLNALRVEDPDATVPEIEAEVEALQGELGHRRLVVHDERHGAALAPGLEIRGWNVHRLLAMVRDGPPRKSHPAGSAAEADRALAGATLAAFRREQPFGWQDEAVRQLAEMDARHARVLRARHFVAPPVDPASVCCLYADGAIAEIDEVGTLSAKRGRGLATAVVLAAADAAEASGAELVFLMADAADWPKALYRRLGFEQVGAVYEFLKLPIRAARP